MSEKDTKTKDPTMLLLLKIESRIKNAFDTLKYKGRKGNKLEINPMDLKILEVDKVSLKEIETNEEMDNDKSKKIWASNLGKQIDIILERN